MALSVFPFVCNARFLDHQFFLIFPHEVSHHKVRKKTHINSDGLGLESLKVPKVSIEIFGKSLIHKNTTGQSTNVFLYFLQKQHVSKNLALEL